MGFENTDWRATAASALEWWRDAGVDVLVDDAPRDWLAVPPSNAPLPGESRAPAGERDVPILDPGVRRGGALPERWDEFVAWRSGPEAPEADLRGVAILASGPAYADIMILSDCPDREDEPDGALLGGAAGRLFDRMLAAIGLKRGEVHLASVCAKRPVARRMPPELVDRLHDCARHHVALVAPKRLLLIGDAASRAVLGTEVVRARGNLHQFSHKGVQVDAVATHHPRLLLERPERKADAWKDLQLLMKGLER